MASGLSFKVSSYDFDLITQIADRARKIELEHNPRQARKLVDWRMDITATHASGNPLRLEGLLAADDFNFMHDVFGICRHLDRMTGELGDFFSPRFSAPSQAEAA